MKRISCILSSIFLLSFVVGCSAPATPANLIPDTETLDTPAPAEINAPLIESPAPVKIYFLNERDGWGVTETQIVRTNDGGITWYNVTPPDVIETGYSVDVFVLDNNHVWMQKPDFDKYPYGGFLYRTSDGGITWTLFNSPFSGGYINFLDANNGWALADLGKGAGSNAVAVYQTNDGGASWNLNYINDPNHASAAESLPLGGLKYGLAPLDMQTAWIHGVVYAPGTPYLFRTDDSGATWTPVTLPLPQGVENSELTIEQIRFLSPTNGFITMRITSDEIKLAVYVSSDAGDTWSLAPTLIPGGGSADFLSANEMIVYNREQFYVTRDAARTWSIVPPDILFGDIFSSMDFVNTSSGYVLTQDPTNHRTLYRTSDGGTTWFPVIP